MKVVLVMKVVIVRGRVSRGDFVRGRVHIEGCSEDLMYFFFFSFYSRYIILVHGSCDHY